MAQAQRRAVLEFRNRQEAAGITRFEVAAPRRDKELIRSVAKRLSENGADAEKLRAEISVILGVDPLDEVGAVWRALRDSPLVGADVKFPRIDSRGRKIKL